MKLNKFLFFSNQSNDNNAQYILHTHHPKALIEVSDHYASELPFSKTYSYRPQNEVLPRTFTLKFAQIYEQAKNWNPILDEAWQWHVKNVIE